MSLHVLRVIVVQSRAVRCPVSSIAAGRHDIGLVKEEALYGQREKLMHSALLFTLLLARLKAKRDEHTKHIAITLDTTFRPFDTK